VAGGGAGAASVDSPAHGAGHAEAAGAGTRPGGSGGGEGGDAFCVGAGLQITRWGVAVRVGVSGIPSAGRGLFAAQHIPAGAPICDYDATHPATGERVTLTTREAMRLRDKRYLMRVGPGEYTDAGPCCVGRLINDARNPARTNAAFHKRPGEGRAVVVALRSVAAGEEVFASYGRLYWLAGGGERVG
jgi:hypothetical protein